MKSTDDVLTLMEDAFLTISLEARYKQSQMGGVSTTEGFKMFQAAVCDELMQKCRPLIEKYLEEHYANTRRSTDLPDRTD